MYVCIVCIDKRIVECSIELQSAIIHVMITRSTIKICVSNYIEHLVHQVIGLNCVYSFLYYFDLNYID